MGDSLRLEGPCQPPLAGGAPRQLVILLHGLGADGADLIDLAPYWARALPHAEFLAPDAPFPCDMAPFGRQWFSLLDRTPSLVLAGVRAATPHLDAFIDQALAERDLGDGDLALVGFSQGCMMALHVALRRPKPCAAVVGYSGGLAAPELLSGELRSRPPVLLIHGDADTVVPVERLAEAQAGLSAAGVPVRAVVRPDLDHGIDPEGLALGVEFVAQSFNWQPK